MERYGMSAGTIDLSDASTTLTGNVCAADSTSTTHTHHHHHHQTHAYRARQAPSRTNNLTHTRAYAQTHTFISIPPSSPLLAHAETSITSPTQTTKNRLGVTFAKKKKRHALTSQRPNDNQRKRRLRRVPCNALRQSTTRAGGRRKYYDST